MSLTRRHTCVCRLSRLPVQSSGIALNIVAIAGLLDLLMIADPSRVWLKPFSAILYIESALLIALYILRALCSSSFVAELSSRTVISSHCVMCVAIDILCSQNVARLGAIAVLAVHCSCALNLLLSGRFLYLCARRRALVEPVWFPATISVSAISLVGPAVGSPAWARVLALIAGCVATACLWPPCVYRALRYPRHVACNPSIFILMAPVPFLTMAMFRSRAEEHTPLLGPVGMDIFFILNCANVILCIICVFQRRRALYATLCPMDPRWAALTFPLVSTASVSLYYANDYSRHALLSSRNAAWTAHASSIWASVLVPLALVLVPCTDLAWMLHLPNWCFFNPPPRIDSIEGGLDGLDGLARQDTPRSLDEEVEVASAPQAAADCDSSVEV